MKEVGEKISIDPADTFSKNNFLDFVFHILKTERETLDKLKQMIFCEQKQKQVETDNLATFSSTPSESLP